MRTHTRKSAVWVESMVLLALHLVVRKVRVALNLETRKDSRNSWAFICSFVKRFRYFFIILLF